MDNLEFYTADEYAALPDAPPLAEYNGLGEPANAAARKTLYQRMQQTIKFAAMAGLGTAGLSALLSFGVK